MHASISLSQVVDDHGLGFFRSDLDPVYSTNLLFVDVDPRVATAQEFVDRLKEVNLSRDKGIEKSH